MKRYAAIAAIIAATLTSCTPAPTWERCQEEDHRGCVFISETGESFISHQDGTITFISHQDAARRLLEGN